MQIEAKQLRNTLKILSGVVKENKTSPALEGVLINKTSITGGNDVLTIKLPFENDLPECLLEFETLLKMANSLNGLLEVKEKYPVIEFKGQNGKISVPIILSGDYPEIKPEITHKEFSLTYDELQDVTRLAAFIDPKSGYEGIYYNGSKFSAFTSSYAGFYEKITDKSINIAVFPEVFKSLLPINADHFTFKNGTILAVKDGNIIAEIKYLTIVQSPPDFGPILAKKMPYIANGTSYDFKNVINLLGISVNQRSNIAAFNWFPLYLKGKSTDPGTNKESECEIDVDVAGLDKPMTIGLNLKMLESCINYLDSETISIAFQTPTQPLILTGLEANKTCFMAPFKLDNE